jgi:hypothetical protein
VFSSLVGRGARLRFARKTWNTMFAELGRRAGGTREAGAFLLSRRDREGRTVTGIVYYDDLDPAALRGDIRLDAAAYGRLWDLLDHMKARVVADVHTHGGTGIGQSTTDQRNPMIARLGHIAVVVPYLGGRRVGPSEVGVHVYEGESGWRDFYGPAAARLVYVGWLA